MNDSIKFTAADDIPQTQGGVPKEEKEIPIGA